MLDTATTAYYVWEPPGGSIAVHLSLDVVERLEREVVEAFRAVTRRGSEMGGLLIGRTVDSGRVTVFVEDYEPIPCGYQRGPLYQLTPPERLRLQEAASRYAEQADPGRQVIGFFRGNTRKDLALDQEDRDLVADLFSGPHQVFLLVKPFAMKPCVAGLFVRADGRPLAESAVPPIPFRKADLLRSPQQIVHLGREEPPAVAPPAVPPPAVEPPLFASFQNRRRRLPWAWLLAVFALLGGGGLLLFESGALTTLFPAPEAAPVPLALHVESRAGQIVLRWNPGAQAVERAVRGSVTIADGTHTEQVPLDAAQLQSGNMNYFPVTAEVSFRLDLTGADGAPTASESIRAATPAR